MPPEADVRELARRVLAVAGADPLQATVTWSSGASTRVTAEAVEPEGPQERLEVHVLVVHDGCAGAATARGTDDAALAAAVEEATRAAAGGGVAHPGLPASQPVRAHDGYDPVTARHEPVPVAAVREAAGGADLAATWTTRATETAIASTSGVALHDRATRAQLELELRDPATGRSAAAAGAAARAGALDVADVAGRARAAFGSGEPVQLEAGPLPVVLGPEAVAAILTRLGSSAFDGLAHAEGRGALTGRLGTRVASSAINLSDSPRFARTLPAAFDADGVPKAPVPLIQDGVAHRVVHDLRSAAVAGGAARSSGHATAPGGGSDGPRAEHLVLIGGGAADVEELCRPVTRGAYVSRLAYGDDDVATAAGAVAVVDGRREGPVDGLRLAVDPLAVLRGAEALTSAQWLVVQGDRASVVAPALRTSGAAVVA